MMNSVDLLWSVDYYLHRDVKHSALKTFNPLYITRGTDTSWVDGRDGKGKALKLEPTNRGWAVIGKWR